jgi:hypothetical protein
MRLLIFLTCDKYNSSLRHIHDPVLSSLKMTGIRLPSFQSISTVSHTTSLIAYFNVTEIFSKIFHFVNKKHEGV